MDVWRIIDWTCVYLYFPFYLLYFHDGDINRAFIYACYRGVLRRKPDPEGFLYFYEKIQKKQIGKKGLFKILYESNEYTEREKLDWANIPDHLHHSRVLAVRKLPKVRRILDLGGANSTDPRGSLYQMGYTSFHEIIIIDWPPDDRFFKTEIGREEVEGEWMEISGKKIKYYHKNMLDLSDIADDSIDMVWSGQSVEHITREEFEKLLEDMKRVLKRDAYFCFDTPNRLITEIQYPDKWINPDHKYEYTPDELREVLEKHNYSIIKEIGERPLPDIFASGVWNDRDLIKRPYVSDNLNVSYFQCFITQVRH